MRPIKTSVTVFYTCLTILGLPFEALAQASKQKPSPANQEQLILDNKDFKKNLGLFRHEGPRTSGGGHSCALAITKNTESLQKYLVDLKPEKITSENLPKLTRAIENAKFYIIDSLKKEGQFKEAKNYPSKNEIRLTRSFCRNEMSEVSGRAMSLLLHEYLGLAGIDDRKYEISGRFLELYSEMMNQKSEIQYHLQAEAQKDLEGKSSCFQGAIQKMSAEMANTFGGRYSPNVTIDTAEAGYSVTRFTAKYCQEASQGQRKCDNTDTYNYLVTAQFSSSTTGTVEMEALAFKVEKSVRTVLVVKDEADYNPTEDEIISRKVTTSYSCTPVKTE